MNEYLEVEKSLSQMLIEGRHLRDCFKTASALSQQICYGVARNWYYYDHAIELLLNKPLPEKHQDLKLILMAGLYSIDNLKRPQHASVNHAVESAVSLGKPWAKGLLNAVMRRYGRESIALRPKLNQSEEAKLNHPKWLIKMITEDWPGRPEIFECNNNQAPMTLRVNTSKITRDAYLQKLSKNKIEGKISKISEVAIMLSEASHAEALPGFLEGEISIQDEAPQLVPSLMNLRPGMSIIDACAAPGGKTCHLLETDPTLKICAIDRDKKRVRLINDNLERLNLTAEIVTQPFEEYDTDQQFDRILIDAPCSATGVIRRHPDIKLLRTKSDVDKLAVIQLNLLSRALDLLKIGGELLYTTCSILRQENDEIVSQFLNKDPRGRLLRVKFAKEKETPNVVRTEFGLQLFPTEKGHDGFFYASIRKLAS